MNTAVWSLELGLEVAQIDQPASIALDRDRLEAGEMCRGGVGAVGAVGNQDLRAFFAPVAEVGGRDQERRELALSTGRRLQADGVQTGNLGQDLLQLVQDASRPWSVLSS